MSAGAASLPCPICSHTGVFDSVQTLKDRLIYVSTNTISCPVCQEQVLGLDKLIIHLFSHVKVVPPKKNAQMKMSSLEKNNGILAEQQRKKKSVSKNKATSSTGNTQVKFVKIYPKLPVIAINTVPILDICPNRDGTGMQSHNSLYVSKIKTEASLLQPNNSKCDICGLHFVDADILRMHRCLIHNIDDITHQTFTRYDCHLCTKSFKMRGSLMVHLRVAHYGFTSNNKEELNENDKCEEKNESVISENKPNEIERSNGKQWQCDVKISLRGETPYACNQCSKTFTFQQSYHKHLLYHNDEKPHTCNFCGRAFKELSTLHNHQRIHTGEKPFACETCGKCFRQRVSYLVHRRIHTGAMPYKCTACEKSFRYKVSQRTHKCQAQPPGTVVRKMGELVEKLKKKKECDINVDSITQNTSYPEVSEVNAELVRTGAQISLEDMESENFTIISEAFSENHAICSNYQLELASNSVSDDTNIDLYRSNIDELIDSVPINDKNIPSPSDILKNLCLSNDEDFLCGNKNSDIGKNYDINKDLTDFL
ncbi:unnamed protein product, partial [Brenthis ino]